MSTTPLWKDGIPNYLGYDRYGNSPYYSGELEIDKNSKVLVDVDLYDESYEFHLVCVWQTEDGKLYGAADSGCSCPTPFSDLTVEGMKPINEPNDVDSLVEFITSNPDKTKVAHLKSVVHKALKEKAND